MLQEVPTSALIPTDSSQIIDDLGLEDLVLLYQPPNHPLLQATEDVWGYMKNYVRRDRTSFEKAEVVTSMNEGFQRAEESGFWEKAVRHCVEAENRYLELYSDLQ